MSGNAQKPTKNNPSGLDATSWYGKAETAELPIYVLAESIPAKSSSKAPKVDTKTSSVEDFVIHWEPAIASEKQLLKDIEAGLTVQVFAGEDDLVKAPDPELLDEGTHFHKLLEFLTTQTGTNTKPEIPNDQEIMAWLGTDPVMAQKLQGHVQTVLNTNELKPYLTEGKWLQAWNELDIVSEVGKSYRMDRLVEFDDHLAILDYKLSIPEAGSEKYKQYQAQLQNYQKELERIRQDKPSKAYLISATGKIIQVA
jgi:ATP-dependent helicase/nuclease subunit A